MHAQVDRLEAFERFASREALEPEQRELATRASTGSDDPAILERAAGSIADMILG